MSRAVLLGIGSNVGDRLLHLRRAVRLLGRAPAVRLAIESVSPIYESDALLPDGAKADWNAPYLNLALLGTTETDPLELLHWIKSQEVSLGREPGPRWSPRRIDIDLLAIEGIQLESPELTLPHREAASRPFVLLPVADVAARWPFRVATGVEARSAAELAGQWRVEAESVPFRARRTAESLTELVGIVNVTDDSFSDGDRWLEPAAAVARARELVSAGATVIDVGAESTRPGATPIAADQEWRRLEPVLSELRALWGGQDGPIVSVDTRHAATAAKAIEAGADWINDVTGFGDPAMVEAATRFRGDLVVMHSVAVPPLPGQTLAGNRDPIEQLLGWGRARVEALSAAGIDPARIILDPGIGFGKTARQTIRILDAIGELRALGSRLIVGHSRKSFLKALFAAHEGDRCWDVADRELETVGLSVVLAGSGVDYLRVHDVDANARALRAAALIRGPVRWKRV